MCDRRAVGPLLLIQFVGAALLVLSGAAAYAGEPGDVGDPGSDSSPSLPPIDPGGDSSEDRFRGELDDKIPIVVPAFHGVEPKIELHYHSSAGNGFVGWGWSLYGPSEISRSSPGHGAPSWTSSDIFLLDGKPLIPCAQGSVSPSCTTGGTHSTLIESYARITFNSSANSWTITATNGVRSTYTPVNVISQGTFVWGLTSVADPHGNTRTYNWWCESGSACYLDTITYNGTTIKFWRESRPDPITFINGVFVGTTNYRLKTIDVTVSGVRPRADKIVYTTSATTSRSLVQSVQQYGKDATLDGTGTVTAGTALPPTTASYQAGAVGFPTWGWTYGFLSSTSSYRIYFGDFNGDGRKDILLQGKGTSGDCPTSSCPVGLWMSLSTGSGFGATFTNPSWTWKDTNQYPVAAGLPHLDGYQVKVADFDGDGKDDIFLQSQTGGAVLAGSALMALSTGTGFTEWTWQSPACTGKACNTAIDWSGYNIYFADFNGDGKADMFLQGKRNNPLWPATNRAVGQYMGLSTGSGFNQWSWSQPTTDWSQYNLFFPDVNGDGKSDIFLQGQGSWLTKKYAVVNPAPPSGTYLGLSTGAGFTEWTWSQTADWSQYNVSFADFNGDGAADLFLAGMGQQCNKCDIGQYMGLSTGNGFQAGPTYQPSGSSAGWTWSLPQTDWSLWRIMFADFDGDKRADLYRHDIAYTINGTRGSDSLALSSGTGFPTWNWTNGGQWPLNPWAGAQSTTPRPVCSVSSADSNSDVMFRDFDGDGKPDLYCHDSLSGDYVALGVGATPDLLTSLTTPLGATTTVAYKPSSAWVNSYLPFIVQTVSSFTTADGLGDATTSTFPYSGGLFDPIYRRFLGFAYTREARPRNAGDSASPLTETWFHQDYGSISKPSQINRSTGAGVLLASTIYQYTTNGSTTPHTSTETGHWEYTYDGTGGASCPGVNCNRTYTAFTYDSYGNVTQKADYGNYDVSGDEKTHYSTFEPNASAYIVSKPAVVETYQGIGSGGAVLAEKLHYYDGATSWSSAPTVGNETQTQRWLSSANSFVTTSATYDAYGNVLTSTDALGHATTQTYDATYHLFATSTTNALEQTTSSAFDYVCGAATSTTDANRQPTSFTYDPLCRLTQTTTPLGGFSLISYNSFGTPGAQNVQTQGPSADGNGTQWSSGYLDGLGRPYQTIKKGPSGVNVVTLTEYNARGGVASRTLPYLQSGETPQTRTMAYDALDRLVSSTNPDGSHVTTSYAIWKTTTTDTMGHVKSDTRDAYGNIVQHQDNLSGAAVLTNFTYDMRGNLVGVTDAAGNAWSYTFDSLKRQTRAVDPDLGTSTFTYDADGHRLSAVDAKGQTTSYAYDAIGRKTALTTSAGTVSWAYDEPVAGYANVGHLTTESDALGTNAKDYDAAGRVALRTRTIGSSSYAYQYAYDAGNRLLSLTYPDGDKVTYTYNGLGQVATIAGIVTATSYDARGNLTSQTNANGTATTRTFSAARQWLTNISTTAGSNTLQNLYYSRDAEGKITSVTSSTTNASLATDETWTYAYDDLDRLTSASDTYDTSQNQSFTYDLVNNMSSNSLVGTYTYPAAGSARPHAVTAAGSNTYSYDADGNMIAGAGRTITYDPCNRPIAIRGSSYALSFAYDADEHRLEKANSTTGATTYYPGDGVEGTGGVLTKYVKLGGVKVAKRVGTTTYWLHTDALGSTRVDTNASGVEVQRQEFRPYGGKLSTEFASFAESTGFTGERQDESGLLYLHARYYDPSLGRFNSADSWNPTSRVGVKRYAYAFDDPVNLVDTNGHEPGTTIQTSTTFTIASFGPVSLSWNPGNGNISLTIGISLGTTVFGIGANMNVIAVGFTLTPESQLSLIANGPSISIGGIYSTGFGQIMNIPLGVPGIDRVDMPGIPTAGAPDRDPGSQWPGSFPDAVIAGPPNPDPAGLGDVGNGTNANGDTFGPNGEAPSAGGASSVAQVEMELVSQGLGTFDGVGPVPGPDSTSPPGTDPGAVPTGDSTAPGGGTTDSSDPLAGSIDAQDPTDLAGGGDDDDDE